MLILNPRATSMTGTLAGQVVRDLGKCLDLHTAQTRYRGHARELATQATADGCELIVTFGGDGTVNEAVNGLMTVAGGTADSRPMIAVIPGGGGNVFARTLGMPVDPQAAVRHIAAAIRTGAPPRLIGLSRATSVGVAEQRYYTFAAGLGLDAEVVADVERARASGHHASPRLYMRAALRRFYTATDRSKPALTLHMPGRSPTPGLFMGVVTNSSPWTYVGNFPLLPVPHQEQAGRLNSGLDVFALRKLGTLTTLGTLHQMMHSNSKPPSGPDILTIGELAELTFSSVRPIAFHIDGEYLGETERVCFTFAADALRVVS
jgi:diacylglycerol kinase family enzyme